ncbi:diguanylate cyclase [Brucepastera parasyntrophica]|uniref:diguanylate cyclase domain-containing protein n=1 Tax=Brucepastera parasyntrophica TaxID=2880008 RepID=UPI00210E7CDF|nr:diguanylate cyclase [Brucepastera parasyntrophica]ULQ60182.1 diguanylate cyclase [Brucepastera parasyntrophica]
MKYNFSDLFDGLFLPVIVCKKDENWPIEYMNTRAILLLSPTYSVDMLKGNVLAANSLKNALHFKTQEEYIAFRHTVDRLGHIDDYKTEINTFDNRLLSVSISAVSIAGDSPEGYLIFYILNSASSGQNNYDTRLSSIINAAFLSDDVDSAINTILAQAGEIFGVSRTYIFEEISPTTTRNTYEWCAPGVDPAIQDLQNLEKADYNYDVIINSGMYITDDISSLPDGDREILEMQGIRALAIITFYDNKKPLGYVGFDDCEKSRKWGYDEIQSLKSISALIAVLIIRRNAEERTRSSLNVLQLISDNSEEIIYINRMDDYSLLFVNKALANSLNKHPEDLIGHPCYKVLQNQIAGPCSFCPMPKITLKPGEERSGVYSWEHFNNITKKTYLVKDNILKWIDGSYVHAETAIDISQRIEYETRLRYYASTDIMTGVANREWGSAMLTEKLEEEPHGSLCFIDIDGLKITNDTYGHTAGDELLTETINMLRKYMTEDSYICRWGGDEFLLWLSLPVEQVDSLMRTIQQEMNVYNSRNDKPFKLGFSYGIVPFEIAGNENLDTLVTAADQLMYKNKMEKRGKLQKRRRTDNPNEVI